MENLSFLSNKMSVKELQPKGIISIIKERGRGLGKKQEFEEELKFRKNLAPIEIEMFGGSLSLPGNEEVIVSSTDLNSCIDPYYEFFFRPFKLHGKPYSIKEVVEQRSRRKTVRGFLLIYEFNDYYKELLSRRLMNSNLVLGKLDSEGYLKGFGVFFSGTNRRCINGVSVYKGLELNRCFADFTRFEGVEDGIMRYKFRDKKL